MTHLYFLHSGHYRAVADKYDYFYKEYYEGLIPTLMKYLDLKPHHTVADIGSGTGFMAEKLFQKSGLANPVWCVDPSPEMQEIARKRQGTYPVLKTAEEFFSDPEISHCFDRVISTGATHHFVDPVAVLKGIMRSLRPGGFFIQINPMDTGHPIFKSAKNAVSAELERELEVRGSLQKINLDANLLQEEVTYTKALTKAKLYEMFRCRYMSMLHQLTDEQIEEGIKELEHGMLKDVKDGDHISYNYVVHVTKFDPK